MKFFLSVVFLSSLSFLSYASSPKAFEDQKAKTISALKLLLEQAEMSQKASELPSLEEYQAKKIQAQARIAASLASAAQPDAKAHSEKTFPHHELSIRGNRVKLFHDASKNLHLLVGKHNDYLAGRLPYGPNELVVVEVDLAAKKENVEASVPLGGDLRRMELYTDAQGTKIRTETSYEGHWLYKGQDPWMYLCEFREFDALTLKRTDEDIPRDPKTKRGDWGVYDTLFGVFFSLWKGKSRHETHVVAGIEGKKKRITLGLFDGGIKIVDAQTSQCEYLDTTFPAMPSANIHVIAPASNGSATAATAISSDNSGGSAGLPFQSTMIVFAGTDTQYVRKAGAPSYEVFMENNKVAPCEYYNQCMQAQHSLVMHLFNMQTKERVQHIIPGINVCCSTRFPDQNGSKIIFACKTKDDKKQMVYKLVLFDPATKQHQVFEKVDPTMTKYEFDPEDISCIQTPEGKNLIALARGSDIFMIDLNV